MEKASRTTCMVINETGWGNGVLELPFIISIGRRFKRIVHTQSPFLESIGPGNFATQWERVEVNWTTNDDRDFRWLSDSIRKFQVHTIINLRNEDVGHEWCRFLESIRMSNCPIDFWDILDQYTGPDPQIQSRWTAMLQSHGLHPEWKEAYEILSNLRSFAKEPSDVLICSGASREDKAVRASIWSEIASVLLRANPTLKIRLLNGTADHDNVCGADIARLLEMKCAKFSVCSPTDIGSLISELSASSVVASNDSFLMHLAYALRRPTLGLFSVTNKSVWGFQDSEIYRARTSNACSVCSGVMPTQGVCWRQKACPTPPNLSWDPENLARDILYLLRQT
jgi:hypothetical protein